jgi:hypothetical protein
LTSDFQGKYCISINIADMVVAVATDEMMVASRIHERYREFLTTEGDPLVTITLKIVPDALFVAPKPGPWVIETSYKGDCLVYESYLERAEIDLVAGRGLVEMAPNANIENLLRAIYAWLCLKHDALLLHAAGIVRCGLGYVFFGPSGAGKTTASLLAAETSDVVSDDLVVLRCNKRDCRLFGVPFKGEFSDAPRVNMQAPLRGMYRLRQDTSHFLEPLSHGMAVAELVASSPFVVRELSLSDTLIAMCDRLAKMVSVQDLHFRRDDEFWKVIDGYFENVP